jgi:hypothetical protein
MSDLGYDRGSHADNYNLSIVLSTKVLREVNGSPWKWARSIQGLSAFPAINLTSFKLGCLKTSSPQRPLEDMQIMPAIFYDWVIRVGSGK